jgi:phage I-like protein
VQPIANPLLPEIATEEVKHISMPHMSLKAQEFTPEATGIAVCAYRLSASSSIQLLPAGKFRASDGRPHDASHWYVNAELAAGIIERAGGFGNSFVIDYEHQTMLTAQNGQPAPAAGWFKKLEWRRAGLYAIGVKWTERAAAMIKAGEYRYISPVFQYDKKTGAVLRLINAALTNSPAIDGMDDVAQQATARLSNRFLNRG